MFKLKTNKLFKVLLAAIPIITVACLVSLITLCINGVREDAFSQTPQNGKSVSPASTATLASTPDYGQNYVNNIIFVCDTTLASLKADGVLKDGANTTQIWTGESGDLSLDYSIDTATVIYPETGESIPISAAAQRKKPDYIVITLGAGNGVRYCTEEKFKSYYEKLILSVKSASPDTKIILQSVLPVSAKYEKATSGISKEKIDTANIWISELAEIHDVRYLDTASILKGPDGYLDPKYDLGNGMQINSAGCLAMLTYSRTHGYR